MKLLYFAPVDPGGLARYAIQQAAALARSDVDVLFLGREHMRGELEQVAPSVPFEPLGTPFKTTAGTRIGRKVQKACHIVRETRQQARWIRDRVTTDKFDGLLISYYFEYFSPFWAGLFRQIRRKGVRIGTVVHDPVRDFQVGPRFWHRWSISQAYSFVDAAFQHDDAPLDTGTPSQRVSVQTIPHGLYEVSTPAEGLEQIAIATRAQFNIPPDAYVLLSFGHIRDGKNLDVLLRALPSNKNVYLFVVGREQSTAQRPIAWYQELAQSLEVADRCRWVNEFVPDEDVHKYFAVANAAVLLYSAEFRSASGVLNNVAQFNLPVLCSSGGGPLRQVINSFELGVWVEPDSLEAASRGLSKLVNIADTETNWSAYRKLHDWDRNAELVRNALSTIDFHQEAE